MVLPAAPPVAALAVPEEATLPAIELTNVLHEVVDRCTAALAAAPKINLFVRDQQLVRVLRSKPGRRGSAEGGPPVVSAVSPATLREELTRVATFQRFDRRTEGLVQTLPSQNALMGLYDRKTWPGVRPLNGLSETPFLRTDGTVCQRPGYDAATGYLLVTRERFPCIPEHPTQEDARKALAYLETEVFGDFPFVSRAARYVPVAAILTLLARPALGNANIPLFAFDAASRGTGKTLAVDMVCLVATGRSAPKTPYPSESAELEKLLGAFAREAASILSFDNIHRPLGGDALDLALTCEGTLKVRILGKSELVDSTWRTVLFATGNNLILKGDTGRRTLIARQETDLERPETREAFRHPDLRAWVTEHRAVLVTAALTVLRAYAAAGQPPLEAFRPLGSFVPWSKLVAQAIAWAGGPNVLEAVGDAPDQDNDPHTAALRVVFARWPALCARQYAEGLTSKQAVEVLYPPRDFRGPPPEPDEFEELREALETLCPCLPGRSLDPQKLAYQLRRYRGKVLDGQRLDFLAGHARSRRWLVRSVQQEKATTLSPSVEKRSGDDGDDGDHPSPTPRESVTAVRKRNELPRPGEGPRTSSPSSPSSPVGSASLEREEGWI